MVVPPLPKCPGDAHLALQVVSLKRPLLGLVGRAGTPPFVLGSRESQNSSSPPNSLPHLQPLFTSLPSFKLQVGDKLRATVLMTSCANPAWVVSHLIWEYR